MGLGPRRAAPQHWLQQLKGNGDAFCELYEGKGYNHATAVDATVPSAPIAEIVQVELHSRPRWCGGGEGVGGREGEEGVRVAGGRSDGGRGASHATGETGMACTTPPMREPNAW